MRRARERSAFLSIKKISDLPREDLERNGELLNHQLADPGSSQSEARLRLSQLRERSPENPVSGLETHRARVIADFAVV
jgi:hypothetical protein